MHFHIIPRIPRPLLVVFSPSLSIFLLLSLAPPFLPLILSLFWRPVVGCFPLDLPSVINHCHPTSRKGKPAASINNCVRARACVRKERGRNKARAKFSKCLPSQWACFSLGLFVNPSSLNTSAHSHALNILCAYCICVLRCPWPKLRDEACRTVSAMQINATGLHTWALRYTFWL